MSNEPRSYSALSGEPTPPKRKAPVRRRKDDDMAEQEQLTDEEINSPGRNWYFLHTYSGHENKVRHAIKSTVEQADAHGYERVRMVEPPSGGPHARLLAAWADAFPEARRIIR